MCERVTEEPLSFFSQLFKINHFPVKHFQTLIHLVPQHALDLPTSFGFEIFQYTSHGISTSWQP
jgi:hypothetical protein